MRNFNRRAFVICIALISCAIFAAADEPANVTGTWKISVSGEAGSAEQTIVLKQQGNKITGTFKGPRQSGPLEGTVEGKNISSHVSTRVPGDTIKGTMSGKGKTGDWTATRAN